MPDWMLAAVTGLGTAAALEMLRHVLSRVQKVTEKEMDDATSFRHDLLARIANLEKDATQSSSERNEWMERYYDERELRTKAQWQLESQSPESPEPIDSSAQTEGDLPPGSTLETPENTAIEA